MGESEPANHGIPNTDNAFSARPACLLVYFDTRLLILANFRIRGPNISSLPSKAFKPSRIHIGDDGDVGGCAQAMALAGPGGGRHVVSVALSREHCGDHIQDNKRGSFIDSLSYTPVPGAQS